MSDIQTTAAPDGWKPTGGAGTVPKLVVPTHIDGLSGEENALLRELAEVWTRHASRNRTLTAYYEAKEPLVDFGLTVPKSIKHARLWICSLSFACSRDSSRRAWTTRSNCRTS